MGWLGRKHARLTWAAVIRRPPAEMNQAACWATVLSPPLSGADNMAIDSAALEKMEKGLETPPTLRLFSWAHPTVTHGYLLDARLVQQWSRGFGTVDIVCRPTGGGAVYHASHDVSLSLLWPRHSGLFPDAPRECYAAVHSLLKDALAGIFPDRRLTLFARAGLPPCAPGSAGATLREKFSVCYQEPVCNDVMWEGKKMVGGALRLTKRAILYQGNILLDQRQSVEDIKSRLLEPLTQRLDAATAVFSPA